MFEYEFMQRAFLAGLILGASIPVIGIVVVLKRLSMIGDALSHTSLAGVAGGLIAGISPVLGALIASVCAALSIEFFRKRFKGHEELAIAIIMALGIGLAGILLSYVPNAANFNTFLFGSIVTISDFELVSIVGISLAVLLICFVLYKQFFLICLDERQARLSGVRIDILNIVFIVITALVVSVASRTVGALVVSSLMVIPVACALQLAQSYKQSVLLASFFGLASSALGLVISYYANAKPGGSIVLVSVLLLLGTFLCKQILARVSSRRLS